MTKLGLYIASVFASTVLVTSAAQAEITGVWSTEKNNSHVRIEPCGDKVCGKIIWLKEPNDSKGKPKTDENNKKEALKSQPIVGLELLKGFNKTTDNEWEDGTIYNPKDGKTYSSSIILVKPDVLEVEGCVAFFCKTRTWNKVK